MVHLGNTDAPGDLRGVARERTDRDQQLDTGRRRPLARLTVQWQLKVSQLEHVAHDQYAAAGWLAQSQRLE